jgi:hypothetical protein
LAEFNLVVPAGSVVDEQEAIALSQVIHSKPWSMSMKSTFKFALALCLVFSSIAVLAEQSARALLDKARDYVASAPTMRRVDTTEQSIAAIVDQRRVEQGPQTNVVTIEIDRSKLLVRQTAMIEGKPLIMLKQGEKAAMKLGAGPWEIPSGPYENLARDLGNLFVCETEAPETEKNAPTWKMTGTGLFDGQEAFVIETEGNTAVPLAQERMTHGIAKAFPGDPAQRPTVKVLEYSSKHWIGKFDARHLQAVQVSKVEMTIVLPNGQRQLIEQSSKAASRYSYEKVAIEIPEAAQRILSQ